MKISRLLLAPLIALGISSNANSEEIKQPEINNQTNIEQQQIKPTFQTINCKITKICIKSGNTNYELGHFSDLSSLSTAEPELVKEIQNSSSKGEFKFDLKSFDAIIGGTSYHNFYVVKKSGEKFNFNSNNQVLGARYNINEIFSLEGGIYKDSFKANSIWLAGNYMPIKLNLIGEDLYLKLGISAILTKKQMMVDGGKTWLIVPMPKLQIGTKHIKLDLGFAPFRKDHSSKRKAGNTVITAQISIPLNFDFK